MSPYSNGLRNSRWRGRIVGRPPDCRISDDESGFRMRKEDPMIRKLLRTAAVAAIALAPRSAAKRLTPMAEASEAAVSEVFTVEVFTIEAFFLSGDFGATDSYTVVS
jgi:hypothetical protein